MGSSERRPETQRWRLKNADGAARIFITAFLVVQTAGYATGLLFVRHTSTGTLQGLAEEFRGMPENSRAAELKYEKSEDEMYIFLHNHILSLALVFFATGGLFWFSSTSPEWLKQLLMVEPFLAIATTFGGIWLMRYVSGVFSWLVLLSGISMAACYIAMAALILRELWGRP